VGPCYARDYNKVLSGKKGPLPNRTVRGRGDKKKGKPLGGGKKVVASMVKSVKEKEGRN